jgi:hypothetical protein
MNADVSVTARTSTAARAISARAAGFTRLRIGLGTHPSIV